MRNRNLLFALLALVACGLIAAGCGDDESTTAEDVTGALEDATIPEITDVSVPDASVPEDAKEALENAPENIDEAVQQCLDNAESSGLSDDQVDNLKELCESGGAAANDALENAQDLQESLGE